MPNMWGMDKLLHPIAISGACNYLFVPNEIPQEASIFNLLNPRNPTTVQIIIHNKLLR